MSDSLIRDLAHPGLRGVLHFLFVQDAWFNPVIHKHPTNGEASSSSAAIRYRDWESGLVLPSLEDHEQERLCGLPDIGGHVMKIPLVGFQVLLCMRLEVRFIQIWYHIGKICLINRI